MAILQRLRFVLAKDANKHFLGRKVSLEDFVNFITDHTSFKWSDELNKEAYEYFKKFQIVNSQNFRIHLSIFPPLVAGFLYLRKVNEKLSDNKIEKYVIPAFIPITRIK